MEQEDGTLKNIAKNVITDKNKMPFPASIGALVSLNLNEGRFYHNHSPPSEVLEAMKYSKTQKYLKTNLTCTLKIYHDRIPTTFGKLTGALVFETRREILHDGIFILVKGLCIPSKKYEFAEKKRIPCLKFNILPYSKRSEEDTHDGIYSLGSGRSTYSLELEKRYIKTAEDLPPPFISPDGKLIYKLQVFVTIEGKQFQVDEVSVPYQGYYNLSENFPETGTNLEIQKQLIYKKSILSRRKFVDVALSCDSKGFLSGEKIGFLLQAKNPDKIALKYTVEILQKLWYQVPTERQSERLTPCKRLSVKMKEIVVASTEKIDRKGKEQLIWKGKIKIPHGQAPAYKYDFLNSISYLLRMTVKVIGDEENGNIVGESTIFIGTVKDIEGEGNQLGSDAEIDDEDDDAESNSGGVDIPLLLGISMLCPFGSMNSLNVAGVLGRRWQRSGSTSSVHSSGSSSTASIFRMPPSYSKLFSRRPTLETLPPAYSEVELNERPT